MEAYATSFSAPTAQAHGQAGLRQQAEELEAVFLNTLVAEMFKGLGKDSENGGDFATGTWRTMQSEQFAAAIAKSGGVGLADQIMASLLQAQEQAQAQLAPTT